MSHMTLEYSGNLRASGEFSDLCRKLAQFMATLKIGELPVFPPGGVRVRAIPCDEYCIADGTLSDAAFVHAVLKIGAGRSDAAKQATTTGLFDIMKAHFAQAYAERGLALSLEINEFSESGTLKHNNLHARFPKP
ncbi:MAG: 5-carboxymethyl-2-hydroxymuconate Delta-isomerase [Steroidobacteraceae bacterium]